MKRFLSIALAMAMALSALAGCGSTGGASSTPGSASQGSQSQQEVQQPTEDEFQASILFCGSTSLYPVLSSLASSFTDTYATWDQVDPSFPEENVSIYVAPGGSGVGVSAAIDRTADFGMLARDIKDTEKEALGENYAEFIVARDALTVSVNASNPICAVMDDMSSDLIRQIFAGELTTWNQVDPSLPEETINVYIRDLSGGAYEVFQKAIMGESEVTASATQSASMTELATNIVNDPWAIGYAGFGAYNKANEDAGEQVLFAMKVDGVEATEQNIVDGVYTVQRPVMFVTGETISDSEQAFIDYIFSQAGYDAVVANGYIPAFTV